MMGVNDAHEETVPGSDGVGTFGPCAKQWSSDFIIYHVFPKIRPTTRLSPS